MLTLKFFCLQNKIKIKYGFKRVLEIGRLKGLDHQKLYMKDKMESSLDPIKLNIYK